MAAGNMVFAFGIVCLAATLVGILLISVALGELVAITSVARAVLCVGFKYLHEA
jgi:hypothetical protein